MLHEIVLALHGCMNSVLNNSTHALELAKVLHPSEKVILKRLIQVGETYGQIQIFISKHLFPKIKFDLSELSTKDDEGVSPTIEDGLYLQAFCDGLQKALQPYRSDIVLLEKMVLKDPFMSLSSINYYVCEHIQLLSALNSMINEIVDDNIHGCKLLQYVCKQLCVGVETTRKSLLEIASCCHSVLINQLMNWLLYGQLMDPYNEFFIKLTKQGVNELLNVVSNESHSTFVSSQGNENTDGSSVNQDKVDTQKCESEYVLVEDYLPPFISLTTAHKILYIGKTVKLLKCDLTGKSDFMNKSEIFPQEELEAIRSLQNSSVQDGQELEVTIVNLESLVTKRLWLLAVDQADLMGQLKAFKDFYLLSRGELFVDFLSRIGSSLNKQVSSNITRDLNLGLVASARNVQYNNESVLEKIKFNLPHKSEVADVKVKTVLRLEYSASLPLHLFFTPVVVDNYNILFRFFLRVKQTQLNLHAVWIHDVKNKTQLLTDRSWQMRNNLMFLVENLQCYLQWDVVESEHTIFLNELKKLEDFEKIRHLHQRFLFNVLSQAFLIPNDAKFDQNTGLLLMPPINGNGSKPNTVHVFLGHILDLSEVFCQLVTANKANISDELERMSEKLNYCVKVLVRLITNLRNQVSGVHLSKLLLRLDYNHYFSSNNPVTFE